MNTFGVAERTNTCSQRPDGSVRAESTVADEQSLPAKSDDGIASKYGQKSNGGAASGGRAVMGVPMVALNSLSDRRRTASFYLAAAALIRA